MSENYENLPESGSDLQIAYEQVVELLSPLDSYIDRFETSLPDDKKGLIPKEKVDALRAAASEFRAACQAAYPDLEAARKQQ